MGKPNAFSNVSGSYGAPMGRQSTRSDFDGVTQFSCQRSPWVDGEYDSGGAYWGRGYIGHTPDGLNIWAVWEAGKYDDGVAYVRASNRQNAIAAVIRSTYAPKRCDVHRTYTPCEACLCE